MEQKKISNAPMILGIIGGIIGLPAAICSGACAAGITAVADESAADSVGDFYMGLGLVAAFLGLAAAFMYKKNPKLWGIAMMSAGVLSAITLVTFNPLSLITSILFLIGGLIALLQKK